MGWLDELLGPRPRTPALPANAVVIPGDLAAELTAGGRPLAEATVAALREHLSARPPAAPAPGAPGRAAAASAPAPSPDRAAGGARPFWLADEGGAGPGEGRSAADVEAALRGRLAQRRAEEGGPGGPDPGSPGVPGGAPPG